MSYKAFESIRKHVEEATLAEMTPAEINKVFTTLQTQLTDAEETCSDLRSLHENKIAAMELLIEERDELQARLAALEKIEQDYDRLIEQYDEAVKEIESLKHMMRQDGWTIDEY